MVRTLKFSLIVSLSVATLVTLVVTVWEWVENPGGIFHDDAGTRWNFVFDTATSWFWPTWLQVFGIAVVGHVIYRWLRGRFGKSSSLS